jgi:hypothetical protein
VTIVLASIGVLFLVFAGRTWLRQETCVRMDEEGISTGTPQARKVAWRDIASFELRYYATRRERARGWMQMTLKGANATLRFESTLDGFEYIADRATRAARRNGVALSPLTVENLRALGIALDLVAENSEGEASIAR